MSEHALKKLRDVLSAKAERLFNEANVFEYDLSGVKAREYVESRQANCCLASSMALGAEDGHIESPSNKTSNRSGSIFQVILEAG